MLRIFRKKEVPADVQAAIATLHQYAATHDGVDALSAKEWGKTVELYIRMWRSGATEPDWKALLDWASDIYASAGT